MTRITIALLMVWLCCSCHHRQTLPESLTAIFADHLRQIDSAATLDSLQIRWNLPVTEKMGRIIDDSIYVREFSRLKAQLAGAMATGDKDSIEFYKYEIHYMEKEIDSIGHGIVESDTSHRYGSLIVCSYYMSKHNKSQMDSTIVFIDTTSTLRFTDFMDSALRRTAKMIK